MNLKSLLVAGFLPRLLCAVEQRPRGVVCNFSKPANNGQTCESFAKSWGLDVAKLKSLNPAIRCPSLAAGQNYCVVGAVSTGPDTTSQSSTSTKTTTLTSTSTSTSTTSSSPYSPTQSGLAPNCDKFYLVSAGDQCDTIVARFSISSAQFYAWNPSVNAQCSNLWLGYYVCVHVPGAVVVPPTPTKPANGIETPQPTQPHMVSYCSRFKWVDSGDTCANIAAQNGISLSDFVKWNPDAGNNGQGLWANAYACVGALPGFTLATYYHIDCTGDIRNAQTIQMQSEGACINTDCQIGAVKAIPQGTCPDGQVQISYWEQPGCTGKWFGYGYTSRDTCRKMWTEGWKFKSLHLRCASEKDDCVSKGTCTFDAEPSNNVC